MEQIGAEMPPERSGSGKAETKKRYRLKREKPDLR
jgi:hypothetical protein